MGRLSDGEGGGSNRTPMRIGDKWTLAVRDKETREIIKTYTLTRTTRPYIDDLCDAYNGGNPRGPWHVDHVGNLQIGDC